MKIIKVRNQKKGKHIQMTFWIGEEGYTLVNIGKLTGEIGDYQIFEAMLSLGCRQTGQVRFIEEGWSPNKEQ